MKRCIKRIASAVSFFVALPVYVLYRLETRLVRTEQPFCGMSQLLSLIPGLIGEYIRREFYKLSLKRCSDDCCISFGTVFSHPTAEIGKGVHIGAYCTIGTASLEDNVLLGSKVDITSGRRQHCFDRADVPLREQPAAFQRIHIGADSWVGNGATIMADVGMQSVVGAGAVVVEGIEERSIVAGNPARTIGRRKA